MQTINKGAPLDVAFINDLVNTVEQLVSDTASSQHKRATIKDAINPGGTNTSTKTSDARIQAEAKNITGFDTASKRGDFEFPLVGFSGTPIVFVTPVLTNKGNNSPDLSVVLTSVSQGSVKGYVVSTSAVDQISTVGVSMIAIGIPGT
jgi:hypothetical protein